MISDIDTTKQTQTVIKQFSYESILMHYRLNNFSSLFEHKCVFYNTVLVQEMTKIKPRDHPVELNTFAAGLTYFCRPNPRNKHFRFHHPGVNCFFVFL